MVFFLLLLLFSLPVLILVNHSSFLSVICLSLVRNEDQSVWKSHKRSHFPNVLKCTEMYWNMYWNVLFYSFNFINMKILPHKSNLHFSFSDDLFHSPSPPWSLFVRNQAIFSNCEVPGHWWLPLPPVGKWKISVACNKYFSVGCLCVYVSIAPKLSLLLLPVLLSFEFFVSLSRLYFSIIPHSSIMIKTDRYFGG